MKKMIVFTLFLMMGIMGSSFFKLKSIDRDYSSIAGKIRDKAGIKLADKYGMQFFITKAGMMDCAYFMGYGFCIDKPITRDQTRVILLDCIQELLTAINSDKKIRPFLNVYPFTTKDIYVSLYSRTEDRGDVYDPYITIASISESNIINYHTREPGNMLTYKNSYSETYEEALEIVKNSHCPLPLK